VLTRTGATNLTQMKKSSIYDGMAAFLYLSSFASLLCAFTVGYLPISYGVGLVLALSGSFFGLGCLLMWGAGLAATKAFTYANTSEHPQWLAQQAANARAAR
jgi:hypothetical protein